jgi:hypothetical protein
LVSKDILKEEVDAIPSGGYVLIPIGGGYSNASSHGYMTVGVNNTDVWLMAFIVDGNNYASQCTVKLYYR